MPRQPRVLPPKVCAGGGAWSSSSPSLLGRLHFDDEVLDWVREALHASHADERREHEEAIARLRAEYDRLQRPHRRHVRRQARWARGRCLLRQNGEPNGATSRSAASAKSTGTRKPTSPIWTRASQILELARNAQQLFERQEPREKRRLLNFVLSNCTWEDGEVVATFRQPFDLLAETTAIAARSAVSKIPNLTKSEIWLPGPDSNQRPTG